MLCLDLILSDRVARAAGVQRSSAMRHQPFRKQSQMQELVRWDGLRKTPIPDSSCWLVLLSSLGGGGWRAQLLPTRRVYSAARKLCKVFHWHWNKISELIKCIFALLFFIVLQMFKQPEAFGICWVPGFSQSYHCFPSITRLAVFGGIFCVKDQEFQLHLIFCFFIVLCSRHKKSKQNIFISGFFREAGPTECM